MTKHHADVAAALVRGDQVEEPIAVQIRGDHAVGRVPASRSRLDGGAKHAVALAKQNAHVVGSSIRNRKVQVLIPVEVRNHDVVSARGRSADIDTDGRSEGATGLALEEADGSLRAVRDDKIKLAVFVEVRVNEKDFFVADALTKAGLRRLTSID